MYTVQISQPRIILLNKRLQRVRGSEFVKLSGNEFAVNTYFFQLSMKLMMIITMMMVVKI